MEKIKIEKTAFVLDKQETERLRNLLKYCRHRLSFHPDAGIHQCGTDISFVDYLLKNI